MTNVAEKARERLEDERNELNNSYGYSSFMDGQITRRIAEIDATLATPPAVPSEDVREALKYQRRAGVADAVNWLVRRWESSPPHSLWHAAGILAREMRDELIPEGTDKLSAAECAPAAGVEGSPVNAGNIVYRGEEWVPLSAYREAMEGWKAANSNSNPAQPAASDGGACNCSRRHDPDQFDHEAGCATQPATPEPAGEGEVPDEDWLTEVLDDSLDMDWTGRVGARAIIAAWDERHGH